MNANLSYWAPILEDLSVHVDTNIRGLHYETRYLGYR
jgi:hypothetical protein